MDAERIEFVFGPGVDEASHDLTDRDEREELWRAGSGTGFNRLELVLCHALTNQILDDEPPYVWATVARLLALGRDRGTVWRDLLAVFGPLMRTALAAAAPFDPEAYATALDLLPLPVVSARTEFIREQYRDEGTSTKILRALEVARTAEPVDPKLLRAVLADLGHDAILDAVTEELAYDADLAATIPLDAFIAALAAVTSRPRDTAVVEFLAAVLAEESLDPRAAEQHLEAAHAADAGFGIVIERLAWYAADRGDAVQAMNLWRRLKPTDEITDDLDVVSTFAVHASGIGRNEPCWCGSGRKYKQCHLGAPETAPLASRVRWLGHKAVRFLDRRGGAAIEDLVRIAKARASDPDDADALRAAYADPLIEDLALMEGGWLNRFLIYRGGLLPEDEAALARTWAQTDRSVYEVTAIEPTVGLTVRDLRTGEQQDISAPRMTSRVRPGHLICARAVSNGERQVFMGAIFEAPLGREHELIEVLDGGDPVEIAALVRDFAQLADLVREKVRILTPNGDEGRGGPAEDEELDEDDDFDYWDGDDDEGDETDGDFDNRPGESAFLSSPEGIAMLGGIRDRYELRWCDEPAPALDGLTPREAAGDPSRRDALDSLIAGFETTAENDNPVALRPAALRELLDL